jgi:hypothetical protein
MTNVGMMSVQELLYEPGRQERGLTHAGLKLPWRPYHETDFPGLSPTLYDPRRTPGSSPSGTAATSPAAMVQPKACQLRGPVERSDMLELKGLTRRYGDLVALRSA